MLNKYPTKANLAKSTQDLTQARPLEPPLSLISDTNLAPQNRPAVEEKISLQNFTPSI